MEWVALAIVLSVVLLLVDKNQKWKQFRRTIIWGLTAMVVLVGTFFAWQSYQEQQAEANAIHATHTPDFIPDNTR